MDEAISQAYSRLTAHEFVLEILMSNWLAKLPKLEADQILEDYLGLSNSSWARHSDDEVNPEMVQMLKDASTIQDRFFEKVSRRSDVIRERLAQAQAPE